jgi:hypothetical protein
MHLALLRILANSFREQWRIFFEKPISAFFYAGMLMLNLGFKVIFEM